MSQEQVTQSDREAWREYLLVTGFLNMAEEAHILEGARDSCPGLLTFARHRLQSTAALRDAADRLAEENAELRAKVEAMIEALTPSGHTKAAYHGEFTFDTEDGVSDAGIERWRKVYVPWTTVKEIMSAIALRAAQYRDSAK